MQIPDFMPRLSVGSHDLRATGQGCVMNAVSYLNGDVRITDTPECALPLLARVAQEVNDVYCSHREGDVLCGPCSTVVWELGLRTIGTNAPETSERLRTLDVPLAISAGRFVLPLVPDPYHGACATALDAAEDWTQGKATADDCLVAAEAIGVGISQIRATDAGYCAIHAATCAAFAAVEPLTRAIDATYGAGYAASAGNAAALLTHLLDTYDSITGRVYVAPTTEQYQQLAGAYAHA